MIIQGFIDQLPSSLLPAIEEFEQSFTYPLGASGRFRISHGQEYTAFYRSMGEACCYIAQEGTVVAGIISIAIRTLTKRDGTKERIAYIGDLKIAPAYQKRYTYYRMVKHVQAILEKSVASAYAVVMDGTDATPSSYTGRTGIPALQPVSKRYILRIETAGHFPTVFDTVEKDIGHGLYCNMNLQTLSSGNAALRSRMEPLWLVVDENACGMLEDTHKAKILFAENGEEIISSHLSYFSFKDSQAGKALLLQALGLSKQQGFPAMFLALNQSQFNALIPILNTLHYQLATAHVFATSDHDWEPIPINTSEI